MTTVELSIAAQPRRPQRQQKRTAPAAPWIVIDDFLGRAEAKGVWDYFAQTSFSTIHDGRWKRIYGMIDRVVLRGPDLRYRPSAPPSTREPLPPQINPLAEALTTEPRSAAFLRSCAAWNQVSFQAYIYPQGSGLRWHLDGPRAAAFIYYAHPDWHPNWGGELLLSPGSGGEDALPAPAASAGDFSSFYSDFDARALLWRPEGGFVFPAPNRLVLIRGGTPHAIKRIEPAAGEAFRASIAGFFSCAPPEAGDQVQFQQSAGAPPMTRGPPSVPP